MGAERRRRRVDDRVEDGDEPRALAAGLAAGQAASQPPLASLLPGPGEVQGWSRDGQAQEFAGDALFDYIDGGAEIEIPADLVVLVTGMVPRENATLASSVGQSSAGRMSRIVMARSSARE